MVIMMSLWSMGGCQDDRHDGSVKNLVSYTNTC